MTGGLIYLGLINSTNDITAGAETIGISPGSSLYALSTFSVKESISNQKAAAFGIPQVGHRYSQHLRIVSKNHLLAIVPQVRGHEYTCLLPRPVAFTPQGQSHCHTTDTDALTAIYND